MIHIVLILLLTRPFDAAVEIVKIVIVPMVIINSVGMVIFFNVFKSIFNTEDLKVASKVSLAMRTAERCTPYLGSVENDRKTAGRIIDIIMEEYHCQGAALIDDRTIIRDFYLRQRPSRRRGSAACLYRRTDFILFIRRM